MLTIEHMIVNHFKRNPRFNQRVEEAENRLFYFGRRFRTAIVGGGLLRIDDAHAREGFFVPEIVLVCVVPFKDLLDNRQPALVKEFCVEFCEGGTKVLRSEEHTSELQS